MDDIIFTRGGVFEWGLRTGFFRWFPICRCSQDVSMSLVAIVRNFGLYGLLSFVSSLTKTILDKSHQLDRLELVPELCESMLFWLFDTASSRKHEPFVETVPDSFFPVQCHSSESYFFHRVLLLPSPSVCPGRTSLSLTLKRVYFVAN